MGETKIRTNAPASLLFSPLTWLLVFSSFVNASNGSQFTITEATIDDIHRAFTQNQLTSRQLVDLYLEQIATLNPLLRSVLEVNPDAQDQADKADREREEANQGHESLGELHGHSDTAQGQLRTAGAVILGKASLNEWYGVRSSETPDGWCARGGQAVNPYVESGNPCGSSSGSAISVAANMVSVSLGTETDGSIICPADHNSVVGIKPTVGLTSRAGVIPISPRQDTIGPICRTVTDAVYVLDAIVGFDPRDYEATKAATVFIPKGGYRQFLNGDGLKGKKLGVVRKPFLDSYNGSTAIPTFEHHLNVLRQRGATIVDNLEIANIDVILDSTQSGELIVLLAEFKISIKDYLKELSNSTVRSLADIIKFNLNNPVLEKLKEYGQDMFMVSENTSGIGVQEIESIELMANLSKYGFEKLMKDNNLDAMVTLGSGASTVLAIGGYPAITVPAGYESNGMPFGISFGGLKGTEPKLIEISYAFEQATRERRPPSFSECNKINQ
uniref:Amidase domain-containing protein n=1 Tax=Fagus sylvatica TaxID=28930 RepID=A0A2N9IJS5_FAGSY